MGFLLTQGQLPRANAQATQVPVEPNTYSGGQIHHYSAAAKILFVNVHRSYPITVVFKTTNRTFEIAIGWFVSMTTNGTCLRSVFFADVFNFNTC